MDKSREDSLLRSVAMQTSSTILAARGRAESELNQAKQKLEEKTEELDRSLSLSINHRVYRRRASGYG